MIGTRTTRGISGIAVAALVLSGASIALATPANAATLVVDEIAPNADNYLGWHEGYENTTPAFSLAWDGLHFGNGASSQILNGLVGSGQPGLETSSDALGELITSAGVDVVDGSVFLQVPVTFGDSGWSTLRPAIGATDDTPVELSDNWISTKTIGDVVAQASTPLGTILDALETQGAVRYSGFGVLADAGDPAVLTGMTWNGDDYQFSRTASVIPVTQDVGVTPAEIRPNEDTYPGWHEGYANVEPAFSVMPDGLNLGNGAKSQIINGLAEPLVDADLADLLVSADATVTSGTAFYQVALTFGTSNSFATLRPQVANTGAHAATTLADNWVSSKAIGATDTTDAIAANTPVALGHLVDALEANTNVSILAFGVLAESPTVVSDIVWNGTRYNFVPPLPDGFISATDAVAVDCVANTVTTVTTTKTVADWEWNEESSSWVANGTIETDSEPVVREATAEECVLPGSTEGMPSATVPTIAGSSFTFTASGFTPNSDVEVSLHSAPVLLDTFVSDAEGVITGTITVPADTAAGEHHIVFLDVATGKTMTSAGFTVEAAAVVPVTPVDPGNPGGVSVTPTTPIKPALASTGVQGDLTLALAGLLLLAGLGIGATRVARRARA